MEGLLRLCAQEGIAVEYVDLSKSRGLLGWYCSDWNTGESLILLDYSLLDSPPLHRCVLADELGHHMTGTPRLMPSSSFSASLARLRLDESTRWRHESAAVRWAADYLIPNDALAIAVREGIRTVSELAVHFNVTPWMIWRKIHFLRCDMRGHHGLRVKTRDVFSPILVYALWGQACSASYALATEG